MSHNVNYVNFFSKNTKSSIPTLLFLSFSASPVCEFSRRHASFEQPEIYSK